MQVFCPFLVYSILKLNFVAQGVLHWVAEPSPGVNPLRVEVRLFDKLFNSEVVYCEFPVLSLLCFISSRNCYEL